MPGGRFSLTPVPLTFDPVELSREKAELEHGVRMTRKANGEAVPEGPRQHGTKAMSWPIMAKEMVRQVLMTDVALLDGR